ncbi:ABC transporter substrate-binding protein [Bacillus sp. DTU_2020_1000418_1_SI_GHA_SEK_038]|uniref:ABC transporter substrate-binding protein n=1 Tax=Bacillus sp. DTU_2020_1000418_1_SI_GHA_SEK_038 TaxID=3077585 RepID=UPI0028E2D39A|nr:ABC transporter substrate-binding protein [Bacillus sp. DTU_2020_1000418_1_SI_GHA_SEK_038]WNS75134.1 ABC transporter substrate-binding protein [Bacillus sp. DTU_2020_1000418_1_SI_GHA_SEK_038]
MKKLFPLLLAFVLMLAGCVKTKSDVNEKAGSDSKSGGSASEQVEIELLGMSSGEEDLNILRDQLVKNGFKVKLNIQPDYGSFKAQQDAGNFDAALSSWTTVTGNPDYAVRSLFKTGGDYSILADTEIDDLIDKASTQTPEEYVETYKQLEQRLVFDKAYIAPLYISLKSQAVNKDVLKPESVRLSKSRALAWEPIDFVDESKRGTDPLVLSQTMPTLTSLDPIKGNDGSINMINTNMYVRLINLTDDDKITSDGSLSLNHSIAEGNEEYYFILRDDINFAKITDKKAVDSGERVGADDVIFSLDRAKNKDSVPDHRTYSLHEHIKDVEVVTDLSVLDQVKQSSGSDSVRAALENGLDTKISELVADKTQANNKEGKYQVVKVTTTEPFPQVLNYLAHQSAGIVSKKQVESINTYDVATFDVNKDIPYGDQNTVTEGDKYNNTLYTSGPYILSHKNDYEAIFYKNPGYMKGTEHEPKIENIKLRFIKDMDSSLSALRNGEIYVLYGVPENKHETVESDSKLKLQSMESNGVTYLLFNTANREVAKNEDLRKAVLHSVNQDEILSYYHGKKVKAVSTVSPLVKTGNELKADPAKVKELLEKYQSSK